MTTGKTLTVAPATGRPETIDLSCSRRWYSATFDHDRSPLWTHYRV